MTKALIPVYRIRGAKGGELSSWKLGETIAAGELLSPYT